MGFVIAVISEALNPIVNTGSLEYCVSLCEYCVYLSIIQKLYTKGY